MWTYRVNYGREKQQKSTHTHVEYWFLNYAHIEVLVTFLLVKMFGFLVITRDHGGFEGRHWVEILPTGLPDLSKPSRDLLELRKTEFFRIKIYIKKIAF